MFSQLSSTYLATLFLCLHLVSAAPGFLGNTPTRISGPFTDNGADTVQDVPRSEEARNVMGEGTFTIKQEKRATTRKRTGLDAMVRAYAKYNVSLPPQLKVAMKHADEVTARKRGSMWGTTSATPPSGYDYEYVSPVKVGTPAQTINMDIDTGSADFWLFYSKTPSIYQGGQTLYYPEKSSTSKRLTDSRWSIGYGDGSGASGVVYTDRVAVGNTYLNGMYVECATYVSSSFTNDAYSSGLFGLGLGGNTVKPTAQGTYAQKIQSSLAAPLFTANLKNGAAGNYNFGYIATFEFQGRIQYSYVDKSSIYWKFVATGYRIGTSTATYTTLPYTAIADTGTTLLLLPDSIVQAYWSKVAGAAYDSSWAAILFPCSRTLPDFTFGIGTYRGVIPGRYMNYGQVNSSTCYGGIQSQGTIGFSIFGDIALKAQFVVFDLGNRRVGFANKKLTT